jgi:hypothetical protein
MRQAELGVMPLDGLYAEGQISVMKQIILAFAIALSGAPSQAESVYTTLDLDACPVVETLEEGGVWRCQGWAGYPVEFSEGDLRQSLFFGHLGSWSKKGHWESFGPFNHIAGTVEWLVDRKIAKAAIARFIIENSNPETGEVDKNAQGQVLVVFKVGQKGEGEACTVGYVDARANPKPNELARKVAADEVATFRCRVDEAKWHGIKGQTASGGDVAYEK